LQALVQAWPMLADPIKAAILVDDPGDSGDEH
jgi:hypothetical protein